MTYRDPQRAWDVTLLVAATALTRFAFRSHYLYDIDSVNFALALRRFDPTVHQPHPPGYFLYVYLGRFFNLSFHDANAALVATSILFSCGAAAVIYGLGAHWFGRSAARFAGMIFVFSPLIWFHGTVALIYIVEAFFSALTGYLCWRIYGGSDRFILPAALGLGIAAGFRPSSLLLLGPLLLFSLRHTSRKRAAAGLAALALALLAWFIPMIRITGWTPYVSSLASLWLTVPSKGMVFNSTAVNSVSRALTMIAIYFLCFGCAAVLPVLGWRGKVRGDRRQAVFTMVWLGPGLLFFTFIYLKFVNSGYLLILAPPACAWMGLWASTWYANIRWRRAWKILAIGCCAAANTAIFLSAPVYCSYQEVHRLESELAGVIAVLPQLESPSTAMIVGFDSHFLGYRHAGYYLPDYLTVQFPEVSLISGTRVFVMQHRNTWLEERLTAGSTREFILFPLPLGDREYTEYMASVRRRLPPGGLRTVVRGGHAFIIGPVADLPMLFPVSAPIASALVYGQ